MNNMMCVNGVANEFRNAFCEQLRAFARYAEEGLEEIPVDENWAASWEAGTNQLVEMYGLRCRAWELIIYLAKAKRIDVEDAAIAALHTAKAIWSMTMPPTSISSANMGLLATETLKQIGLGGSIYVLRVGRMGAMPPIYDSLGWYKTGVDRGAAWANFGASCQPDERLSMPMELTHSQREACKQISHALNIRGSLNEYVRGVWARPFRLMCGASGTGKTAVVRRVAIDNGVPYQIVTASGWIPEGARTQGTFSRLQESIGKGTKGILVIDEIDKFFGESDWIRHCQQELMGLLDGRLDCHGWSRDSMESLKQWLIVGIGTWQDRFKRSASLGFGKEARVNIAEQSEIPEELLYRFSDKLIYLDPPTHEFFVKKITQVSFGLAIPPPRNIDELAAKAVSSKRNMRWLEGYLAERLSQFKWETDEAAENELNEFEEFELI